MASLCVVLLGPPGAGKGTQAKLLGERFEACQVSTGDILRKAVAEESPLGKEAGEYLKRGDLVPDSTMVKLVAERLTEEDCARGFILDGFPRTIPQAQSFDQILQQRGLELHSVLLVQVPQGVIVERLAGRRTCKSCGALYHLSFNPPTRENICDRCGGKLVQRDDDREETIRARLKVYKNQTTPLADYYRKRSILREIDGVGTVEEIRNRVVKALGDPAK
ncbi:MAG TPA: adenylate kinase [Candidatus Binatia bacterium]|nr:adenylate kinase [Candidatus Binatia bacterium]